jgi:hypothetical protein
MKVKNISKKIVAIPKMEGGHTALLPDCVTEVDDSFAGAIQTIIDCGLLETTREKVTPPIVVDEEAVEEKKASRSRKTKEVI